MGRWVFPHSFHYLAFLFSGEEFSFSFLLAGLHQKLLDIASVADNSPSLPSVSLGSEGSGTSTGDM